MEFKLEPYHRNILSEELLDDVKRVANELNKSTVSGREYAQKGKYNVWMIERRFGSWNKALKEANLQMNFVMNVSDEELFSNIEKVWTVLGRQPKRRELKKPISKYSEAPYRRRFGSYYKALEAFIEWINQEPEKEIADKVGKKTNAIGIIQEQKKKRTKREISDRLRFRILLRDGFTCRKCGASPLKKLGVELHVDHIIPWSKGGETIPDNLETKCKKCNLGKGNAFNV